VFSEDFTETLKGSDKHASAPWAESKPSNLFL